MDNCITCEHAIFDAVWGEYKCDVNAHRVLNPKWFKCESYKEGKPKESKANADYYSE